MVESVERFTKTLIKTYSNYYFKLLRTILVPYGVNQKGLIMKTLNIKKTIISVVASTILVGVLTSASAAGIFTLADGSSTDADAVVNLGTLDAGQTHTLTNIDGVSGILSGSVGGLNDDVGTIIIDGNIQAVNFNVGEPGNSLSKLIVNSGKTLDLGTGGINATSTVVGGTVNINQTGVVISGTIDGSSAGVGTLNIGAASTFNTSGVIGGTNALGLISVGDNLGVFNVNNNVSATDIILLGNSYISTASDATIRANISGTEGGFSIYNNTTFIGKVGSSTQYLRVVGIGKNVSVSLTLSGDVFNNPIYAEIFKIYPDNELIIDARSSTIGDGESITLISASSNLDNGGTVTGPVDTTLIDYTTTVTTGAGGSVVVSAAYADAAALGLTGELADMYAAAADVIGSTDELFAALNGATTDQERRDIISSLSPDGSSAGAAGGLGLARSSANTISSHLSMARADVNRDTGIATGDDALNNTVWIQVYGAGAEQKDRDGVSGYNFDGKGFVLGIDQDFGASTILGLALSKGQSHVNSKGIGSAATNIANIQLSAYVSKEFENGFYAEGIASYAKSYNDTSRDVAGSLVASANYESQIYTAQAGVGKTLEVGAYNIIPRVTLSYTQLQTDTYTETGAGGANLTVETQDLNKYEAYLGAGISRAVSMNNNAQFLSELRVGATQEFGDEFNTMSSTFTGGGTFETNGLDAEKTSLDVGVAFSLASENKLAELRLDYDMKAKSDYISQLGKLTAIWKF